VKRIIVPIDFSPCSINAAQTAIDIASKIDAEIDFVTMIDTPVDWVKLDLEDESLYPEVKKTISHTRHELKSLIKQASVKQVSAQKSIVFSRIGDEIYRHIEAHKYDLIIMGTHSKGSFSKTILGSNTISVIRQTNTPVLVVKEKVVSDISKIVFASDFNEMHLGPYKIVLKFAQILNSEVDLLFISIPNVKESRQRMLIKMDRMLAHGSKENKCSKNIVKAEGVNEGIKTFLEATNADVLAICTYPRSVIGRLFNQSIAEEACKEVDAPILVLTDYE